MPEGWRRAKVTRVFQKGRQEDLGSCRAVSLTSTPGEVMEQLLGAVCRHIRDKVTGSSQQDLTRGRSV